MRRIEAGVSKIYNKRRQIYIPKLASDALGADVGDYLKWIINEEGELEVHKLNANEVKQLKRKKE